MKHDNDCSVRRTWLVWIIDILCVAVLIGITIWVGRCYAALPDRIPVHYGANGVIDGYGNKNTIWFLVAGMWGLVVVLTTVEQFPGLWNVPVKVTKENQSRLLTLTWRFISSTKVIVTGIFAYLIIMIVKGVNLSPYFMLTMLTVLVANILYWGIRLFLNR